MPQATIVYFGKKVIVCCDGNCKKAWGVNSRPRIPLSDIEDDYWALPDNQLGEAPADPGTYEDGHAKPLDASHFPNKWCVRQCERCERSESASIQPEPHRWTHGEYNMPWLHE